MPPIRRPITLSSSEREHLNGLPLFAILKGIAQGTEGDRVGVYGYSETNTGIYAWSDKEIGLVALGAQLAAYLDGDVEITKNLVIGKMDVVSTINQLFSRVAALEMLRHTDHGVVVSRLARPQIAVTQNGTASGGEGIFEATYSGFPAGAPVKWYVNNPRIGPRELSGINSVSCGAGDLLTFTATDGTKDELDETGLLWSDPVALTVH